MITAITLGILFLVAAAFYFWASSSTLPDEKLNTTLSFKPTGNKTIPKPARATETFKVMTFNIGYLSGMFNSQPIRPGKKVFQTHMNDLLQLLENVNPGFIAFQEIDFPAHRSHNINQLETIANEGQYPHAAQAVNWDKRYVPFPYWPPSAHFGRTISGQAILSRYPILETSRLVLEKPADNAFYYNAFYLDRLLQTVKIQIGIRQVMFLNIHLEAYDNETRQRQAQVVLEHVRKYKQKYPVFLLGDFNCVPPKATQKKNFIDEPETDYTHDKTVKYFLDEPGLKAAHLDTFTFPSDKPTRQLDYIFYTSDTIESLGVEIPRLDSSDHLPVVMKFRFRGSNAVDNGDVEEHDQHDENGEDAAGRGGGGSL